MDWFHAYATQVWVVFLTLAEVAAIGLVPYVILTRRNPTSAIAWVLLLLFLPVLGLVLFLLVGLNRFQKRRARRREVAMEVRERLGFVAHPEVQELPQPVSLPAEHVFRLLRELNEFPATQGNRLVIYPDVAQGFHSMIRDIETARSHVHLEYYIFHPDRAGARLRDVLIRKAGEGVSVRLICDSVGAIDLTGAFLADMLEAGIQVVFFQPVAPWKKRWGVNFRTHRKITIIDGEIAYTGGANIGDEYLSRDPRLGYWRDTFVRITGPAVRQVQHVFVADWAFATGERLTDEFLFPEPRIAGDVVLDVVPSGPDLAEQVLTELLVTVISAARKRVLLQTCYFAPPEALIVAMVSAAHRGVDVELLVPSKIAHRIPIALWAAQSYYGELLAAGVKIREYLPGMLHSKMFVVDDDFLLIGTPNLDYRSLLLNFELGVVAYDREMVATAARILRADRRHTRAIDLAMWNRRSLWQRLRADTCRLAAPVL